jgi:hypothetical protein
VEVVEDLKAKLGDIDARIEELGDRCSRLAEIGIRDGDQRLRPCVRLWDLHSQCRLIVTRLHIIGRSDRLTQCDTF